MKIKNALLAATLLASPSIAMAQPVDGVYVGLAGGGNYLQDQDLRSGGHTGNSVGEAAVGSVGYGFGNGVRVELEGDWRTNKFYKAGRLHAGGDQRQLGGFLNGFYDINQARVWGITPYVGAGIGYEQSSLANGHAYGTVGGQSAYVRSTGTDGNLAVQGMLGASYPISSVPGLDLTAEYRFTAITGDLTYRGQGFGAGVPSRANSTTDGTYDHTGLVGIRYSFNGPSIPQVPAPSPVMTPPIQPSRTYLVFFDWDRADLTARARDIIASAAKASTAVQVTRIEVDGYTDRSGTQAYNQSLSMRRAQSVAAELVRNGVERNQIHTEAFGEEHPLVPTANGVREPQNRRVEIILR